MKIANIDRESLHIFWTTWGISMKFSEKMWLMTILKVTKNQGFTLFLENTFLEKPQGVKLTPPAFLELKTQDFRGSRTLRTYNYVQNMGKIAQS